VYDALGRLTSATTPESGQLQYSYNSFDLVTQRTDARGVITTYNYDSVNRLTNVSYNVGSTGVPATSTVTLSYGTSSTSNNNGRLVTMTDGAGSENYTYDILGRTTKLDKTIYGTTYTTQYAYNLASELVSVTYPSGRVVQPGYDAIGRLSALSATMNSVNTTYASSYAYNPAGEMTGFNYGNGVVSSFAFSADRLQLTTIGYTKGTQMLFSSNYWYKIDATNCPNAPSGNNGQIQCITDNVDIGRSMTYTYDALYRVSSAVSTGSTAYPKWGLSWTYDRYGNRTDQNQTAGNPPTNHILITAGTNRISGDCYDANGNLLAESAPPCPSPTYTYDAENRMVNYSSAAYSYDGNGLRVKKVSGSTTTVYIFSGPKVIAEYDNGAAPGSPSREYIYSGGALLAKIESSATTYYHPEHLSNRLMTDANGNITGQRGHYPFGETWYESGTATKLKFTSYERDAESGNDFAMARYHVNRLGRFSAPDPLAGSTANPQSLNRYAYTLNDPVNLTDPSGLFIAPQEMGLRNAGWLNYDPFGGGWNEFDLLNSSTVLEGVWINWHIKINPGFDGPDAWFVIDSIERVYGGLLMDPGDPGGPSGSLTTELRGKLKQALTNLAARCKKLLPFDKLSNLAASLNFYDARQATGDGAIKGTDIVPGGTPKTLFQATQPGDAAWVMRTKTGQWTSNVVIGPAWGISPQDAVLVHEATHIARRQDDNDLWKFAQSQGAVGNSNLTPSANLTNWIAAGCPDEKKK
jgi:RHS repeat-associated protein